MRPPEKQRNAAADNATLEEQCHPRKIFVGGLAHKTTTQHLREHFLRHGPIVDAVVLRWPDGRSRGFGYVTFADVASASAGLRLTHHIGGRAVDVKRAVPGTNKLFVGGLPQNTTAQELREHFETFGVVSDAVVMIDPATSRSRGFGFICFLPGQEGATAVASALEQYEFHHIRGKWIEVKSASPPHRLVPKDGASSTSATDADEGDIGEMLPAKGGGGAGGMQLTERQPRAGGRPVASPCSRWGGSDQVDNDGSSRRQTPSVLGEPQKVALPSPPGAAPRPLRAMIPPAGAAPGFYPPQMPSGPWLQAMAAAASAAAASTQQPPPGLAEALAGYHAGLQSAAFEGAYGGALGGGAPWPPPPPAHTAAVSSAGGGMPPGLGATVPGYPAAGFLEASPDFHLNLQLQWLLRQSLGEASLYSAY